jgi:hypothetical protein
MLGASHFMFERYTPIFTEDRGPFGGGWVRFGFRLMPGSD